MPIANRLFVATLLLFMVAFIAVLTTNIFGPVMMEIASWSGIVGAVTFILCLLNGGPRDL